MRINTRDFGEIEIDERQIVTFVGPIFGFESLSRFAFLYDQEISSQFVWLQSLEDPDVCFILVDPAMAVQTYSPAIPEEVMEQLGAQSVMCWLVAVISDDFTKSTVNLKSPIVVNSERKRAVQVILEEDLPIRHPLFSGGKERSAC